LTEDFDSVTFQHIPREQNRRADALCNKALDGANSMPAKKPPKVSPHSGSTHVADGPKAVALAAGVRHDILECLRAVACAWSTGNPNHPKPEEVWDQLWTILEEAGALKTGHR
jgi:hypothetical protein